MGNTQSLLLDVQGEAPTNPEIRVQPTVQRAAPVANVGWKYRRRYTLTNTGARAVLNRAFPINFGATNALVTAGKLLASGNDLRVWLNGVEIPRTLNTVNSASDCHVWVRLVSLGAGESVTFDVVYGNASAGAPPTLTGGDDLPAFDIAATGASRSTKTFHKYLVEQTVGNAGLGAAWLSSGTVQPEVRFNVPGAWGLVQTKLGNDDSWQLPYSTYTASGTKYNNRFDARRARVSSLDPVDGYTADGLSLKSEVGIVSVKADMKFINMAQGDTITIPVGQLVILYRNSESENWIPIYTNNSLQATETTITAATYTFPSPAAEVAFAVWPYDGFAVPQSARPDRYVNACWATTLEVTESDTISQANTQAETEVYEMACEVRYGGGGATTGVPPYKSIELGNRNSLAGAGTPRMAVELNQQVVIFTDTRRVEVWNSVLTAKVEDVPVAAYSVVDGVLTTNGGVVEQPSVEWMPLLPMAELIANAGFEVNASGWTYFTTDPLMIAGALTRDATVFSTLYANDAGVISTASGKGIVTANTSGTGKYVGWIASPQIPVGLLKSITVGAELRTSNANLVPGLGLLFYDPAGVQVGGVYDVNAYTPVLNTFNRRVFAALVPAGATQFAVAATAYSKTSNQTGSIWIDNVAINDTELVFLDVSPGSVTLSARWLTMHTYL